MKNKKDKMEKKIVVTALLVLSLLVMPVHADQSTIHSSLVNEE